jgi:protein transport protein SEC24
VLSKYTGGNTYYYPSFYGPRDGKKFDAELRRCLTRSTAFEAVMRVRATRGIRITNFYGNYFIRGTDLLALPNCTADSSFALDMAYDEPMLAAQAITVQAALLYTSSNGERRIRVHTMVLPVTQSLPEMLETIDIDCMVNILAKQAVEIAQKTGLDNARQRLHTATVDILRASKNPQAAMMGGGGGGGGIGPGGYASTLPGQYGQPGYGAQAQGQTDGPIPLTLQLLPLYSMSLQKCLALRGGNEVRTDERAYVHQLLLNMDIEESKVFVYPRMFSIHDMGADAGLPTNEGDEGEGPVAGPYGIRLPSILNLSNERLASDGIFLMENGYDLFMWIGRSVNPALLSSLFALPSLEGVDMSTLAVDPQQSEFSSHVNAIITALRADRSRYMHLHFIREGDGYAEAYFARYLVEDRANFPGGALSYTEYFGLVSKQISGLPG